MRDDMYRVLVERPRYGRPLHHTGSAYPRGRIHHLFEQDLESAPRQLGMKTAGRDKQLSDLLGPLRRFLRSRAGLPWDEVYSEVRSQLAPSSTLQRHLLEHLYQYVSRHVVMRDGLPYTLDFGGARLVESYGRTQRYYVSPTTGLLLAAPRRLKPPRPIPPISLHYLAEIRSLEGAWRTVVFAPLPRPNLAGRIAPVRDVLMGKTLGPSWEDASQRLFQHYARSSRYAVEVREPGLRESKVLEEELARRATRASRRRSAR